MSQQIPHKYLSCEAVKINQEPEAVCPCWLWNLEHSTSPFLTFAVPSTEVAVTLAVPLTSLSSWLDTVIIRGKKIQYSNMDWSTN